jgi:hypothetical protein
MHLPELAILDVLPLLSPRVVQWRAAQVIDDAAAARDRLAHRTVRRFVLRAGEAGAITGTSFYVGMAPAAAMIYCDQILVVLQIAALYGRDPRDAARAAELLVFQRRYASTAVAEAALRWAGSPAASHGTQSRLRRLVLAFQQLPSMIGFEIRKMKNPLDVLIVAAEIAAFFVPVISIPVWAYASGASTRRVGRAAIAYYGAVSPSRDVRTSVVVRDTPSARARRKVVVVLLAVLIMLGIVAPFVPLGRVSHFLPLGGIVLAELALVLTGLRLFLVTRPVRPAD